MVYLSPQLKEQLNKTKRKIDNNKQWMFQVKKHFEYEKISHFDNEKRASRAFYKFMEILRKWEIVRENHSSALSLCEAPGGFIQAIKVLNPEIEVYGQSLGNSIKFDNKIDPKTYEYSDLTDIKTIIKLAKDCRYKKYDLVTADGGVDVSDDYSKQESKNLRIIYCQILCMLYCLNIGGNFILKIFDSFSKETVQLLQLLSNSFDNFELVKPVLSRPCNSEKYAICRGFKGYSTIPGFSKQINEETIKFNIKVSLEFHNQIIQMNHHFVKNQIESINYVLDQNNKPNIRNQLSKSMNMFKELKLI